MGSVKKPIDNFLSETFPDADGTVMTPARFHGMVDGLEAEDFGVSDFVNGTARVVTRLSDVSEQPAFAVGQVWSTPSETSFMFLDVTTAFTGMSGPAVLHGAAFEHICILDLTGTSLGTPLYFEQYQAVTQTGGFIPLPKASVTSLQRGGAAAGRKFSPAFGLAMQEAPNRGKVRVGIAGLMWGWTDTATTFGDGAIFDMSVNSGDGNDEVLSVIEGNLLEAPNPDQRVAVGVFLESDNGITGRPVRMLKQVVPVDEDRV